MREYPVKLYLCGDTHKLWVRRENDILFVQAYEWKKSFNKWQPFTAFNEYFAGNKPQVITKMHPISPGMGGIGKTEICRLLFKQYLTTACTIKQLGWIFYQGNIKDTFWKQFPEIEAKKDDHGEYSILPNPEYGELTDAEVYWTAVKKYINRPEPDILLIIDNAMISQIPKSYC